MNANSLSYSEYKKRCKEISTCKNDILLTNKNTIEELRTHLKQRLEQYRKFVVCIHKRNVHSKKFYNEMDNGHKKQIDILRKGADTCFNSYKNIKKLVDQKENVLDDTVSILNELKEINLKN
jgi:ribosomal protein S4